MSINDDLFPETGAPSTELHENTFRPDDNQPDILTEVPVQTALRQIREELFTEPEPAFWQELQREIRNELEPSGNHSPISILRWFPKPGKIFLRLAPIGLMLTLIILFASLNRPLYPTSQHDLYLLAGGLPDDRFSLLLQEESDTEESEELYPAADPWNDLLEEMIRG